MRLIDADELSRKMCNKCIDTDEEMEKGRVKWDSGLWIRYKVFEDTLALTPTVDAEPIRHGHWRADETVYTTGEVWCSVCRTLYYIGDLYDVGGGNNLPNYCPNCGAKMDQEEQT